jgi:tetratricopeptide (TPR) repeat protein
MSPTPPAEPNEVADLVVTWSGYVLAGFTLLVTLFTAIVVIAGIFGLREIKNITEVSKKADEHLGEARMLLQQLRNEVEGIGGRMNSLVEVSYLFNQGELAYREGEYEKAVEFLGRAAALDPRNVQVLYRLGRAFTNVGDDVAAPLRFKEMLELGVKTGDAERGLALVYRYTDSAQALRYARQGTRVAAGNARNWNCLGLILRDQGELAEARAAHERAAEIDDQSATTPFYLALLAAGRNAEHAVTQCHVAVYRLDQQERRGQMKMVWGHLIRWADHVLAGRYVQADESIPALTENCRSRRRVREVCGHMDFLLRALRREEFRDRYLRPVESRWPPPASERA